jgi:hypothetical protein
VALKMFEFRIRNTKTNEVGSFLGQGETLEGAWKDGTSNVAATFRPKSDGQARGTQGMRVELPNGQTVTRQLKNFEGDEAYNAATEATE